MIGNEDGPSTLVAGQSEAFQVFSSLCDKVEAEAGRKRRKEKLAIDRTLPPFQAVPCVSQQQPAHEVSVQHHVLPPLLGGIPKVRVTKAERRVQQCIDAALHKLEESQCLALKEKGLGRLFNGLRAPRFISFQFANLRSMLLVLLGRIFHDCDSLLVAFPNNVQVCKQLKSYRGRLHFGSVSPLFVQSWLLWLQVLTSKKNRHGLLDM